VTVAVVAEKPAVARDIASVLGAAKRGEGFFEGRGYVVTWAIGHLVALAQPHEIDPAWKRWSLATLPMLPEEFPLVVVQETRSQFEVVRRILKDRTVEKVVCATDAGREGELIFRYIYEAAGCKKPVERLWISSLTPDAIRDGFRRLRRGADYDGLADAARGRSRADWLVGMNLSRAYSLALDQEISVGRVQTPTLAMLVEREVAIRDFVPEDYLEVVATFEPVRQGSAAAPARPGSGAEPAGPGSAADARTTYEGTWFRPPVPGEPEPEDPAKRKRLPPDGEEAQAIVARALSGKAVIESVEAKTRKMPPPLLYDLTELQRHANRLYGMSAQRTLETAQALYERHKLISYPRTDSRHLSTDVAATLESVVAAVEGRYPGMIAPGTGQRPLGRRFVDDSRVTDHHAILPTATPARDGALGNDERRIYDLVCRRLLQAWHEDHVWSVTTVITKITNSPPGQPSIVDRYESRGTAVEKVGWKVLDIGGGKKAPKPGTGEGEGAERGTAGEAGRAPPRGKSGASRKGEGGESDDEAESGDATLPAGLARGQAQSVLGAEAVPKRTRPPPRFTEATLLTAMETAGRTLEEKELSDAMKDLGLGTPATRAQIIETLLKRDYMVRQGKSLAATEKGMALVSVVHPEVKSPAMTGEWEAKLKRMQRGQGDLRTFMAGIETYVTDVVARVSTGKLPKVPPGAAPANGSWRERDSSTSAPPRPASSNGSWRDADAATSVPSRPPPARAPDHPRTPTPPTELRSLLRTAFGLSDFRPYQETVCRAATAGRDLLLVMPTGAGKSLCYQLPGIARAGTTLVVSPLIALMEDQAAKLSAQGFRAERIHSGRERRDARAACVDYLAGRLDFLFIAPERLRVPGFPEMLAKRPPALVAVDEAHCISEWGHDFRPDYRLLGQRLPALRPAPIIALTATATPDVQDDIVAQLGLRSALRFIHGFRRTNIGIELVEIGPGERPAAVRELLSDPARRPAIVYASTRKSAEDLAAALGPRMAAAYHAGMAAEERDRVQSAFLAGRLEVVVATIAFGMGIDKADVRTVVHAALPGSLEGYYQEIGRAGRDGRPSRAVLMHAYVDRKMHEFFHERDYPDPAILEAIHKKLGSQPVAREKLQKKAGVDPDVFDKALEKLVTHGAAEESLDGEVTRAPADWKEPYLARRDHKLRELQVMVRFTASHGCRMVHLVRHFGDQEDAGDPCGLCDVCAPDRSIARRFREASPAERASIARILDALSRVDGQATGRLHRETFAEGTLDRRSFEHLLAGLVRAGLVTVTEEVFEKDGQQIAYQRASLTPEARTRAPSAAEIATIAVLAGKEGRSKGKGAGARGGRRGAAGAKGKRRSARGEATGTSVQAKSAHGASGPARRGASPKRASSGSSPSSSASSNSSSTKSASAKSTSAKSDPAKKSDAARRWFFIQQNRRKKKGG
jgi:DNA topoisomerase-3